MATTKRDSTVWKEKRVTSLSNSSITHHPQRRPFQPSSEKQAPNYLKPTISSRNDAIKNSKKTGPLDPSQRPNLLRRRSFDGPPSVARPQQAPLSPGRDKSMSRSASSCSKTTTAAAKSSLERVSGKPNAGKAEGLSSPRSLKKTSNPTTKEGRALVSKKRPHEKKEAQNLETEHGEEEIKDHHHQVEEVMKTVQGERDGFQMPKAEESEHVDVVDITEVIKSVEDGKDTLADISTVRQEYNVPDQTGEMKEEFQAEKSGHTQHDEDKENHRKGESNADHDLLEKIPHEDAKTETEDGGKVKGEKEDCATEEVTDIKEIVEEKQLESSQQEGGEGREQMLESSKEKMAEREDEKSETEAANVVVKSQVQAGHGKKESPTPYNDVIEETASRLREERKNKVLALVGAFETVIDKESSNAK